MIPDSDSAFIHQPDPENPGWHTWNLADGTRFNAQGIGKLIIRPEDGRKARLRMMPEIRHSNLHDSVHGGVTLTMADIAMFATARILLGADVAGAVTLELSCQFIGAGRLGKPLDAVTEILRETRRLVFLRGLVVQQDDLVASYSGSIRKPSPPRA